MKDYLVCAGGVSLDIHSASANKIVPFDSNPGKVITAPGGVIRNIAENLSRMGFATVLLSAVGKDAFGETLVRDCLEKGIDATHVMHDSCHSSPVYLDVLDETGDMYVAVNDMKISECIPVSYFQENDAIIREAAAVMLDTNLSREAIESVCKIAAMENVPVYADPVSTIKAPRLLSSLPLLHFIKPNRMELSELTGLPCDNEEEIENALTRLLENGPEEVCVTLGKRGSIYADHNGLLLHETIETPAAMKNATGAGDAFCAGFAAAELKGFSKQECLKTGSLCSRLAVESAEAVSRMISPQLLK